MTDIDTGVFRPYFYTKEVWILFTYAINIKVFSKHAGQQTIVSRSCNDKITQNPKEYLQGQLIVIWQV
jgi:hypothetical protein